jgi:hypothetical protein
MGNLKNASKEEIETMFMELADNMASSATDLKGHNYFQFLEARKCLFESIHKFVETYVK